VRECGRANDEWKMGMGREVKKRTSGDERRGERMTLDECSGTD
jgi:hypothetical protein